MEILCNLLPLRIWNKPYWLWVAFGGADEILATGRRGHNDVIYCGIDLNLTYDELCTGLTGHAEAVLVVLTPNLLHLSKLLKVFGKAHNPTQGWRQRQ